MWSYNYRYELILKLWETASSSERVRAGPSFEREMRLRLIALLRHQMELEEEESQKEKGPRRLPKVPGRRRKGSRKATKKTLESLSVSKLVSKSLP